MTNNDMRPCPACGALNRSQARFCSQCRAELPPASKPQPSPAPGAGTLAGENSTTHTPTTPLEPGTAATKAFTPPAAQPQQPIKSAAEDKTQPLLARTSNFTLLPVGAAIQGSQGTYVVLEGRIDQPGARHVYLVEQLGPPRRTCPNCGQVAAREDEAFCPACGADLSAVRPTLPHFLVKELADDMAMALERSLVDQGLPADGLLLPTGYFSAQLWEGQLRHYLLYPGQQASQLQPASSLPKPQPPETVLQWGTLISQGLHALHNKRLAHGQVDLDHIAVHGEDARLSGLEGALSLAEQAHEEAKRLIARDISGLANSLEELLGGPEAIPSQELAQVLQAGQGALPDRGFPSAKAFGQALQDARQSLMPGDIKVRVGHRSDAGVVRDHNEDNAIVVEKGLLSVKIPLGYGVYVLADGMGGHAAGEVASDLAAETVVSSIGQATRSLEEPATGEMLAIVKHACLEANRAVHLARKQRMSDMGTTLVVALRIGDRVVLANMGDSRAYLVNAQAIKQITVDHSLVQRLIDTGQISEAEARVHPQRNLIYKIVGDKPGIEPDTFTLRLQPGDRLLLCSDGLSGMVDDETIWQTALSHQDPQTACERLVAFANQAGGEDNITVIIVQAEA